MPCSTVTIYHVSKEPTASICRVGTHPSTLKVETIGASETVVNFHHTIQRHMPEDDLHSHYS
jgi:hypothetical protein